MPDSVTITNRFAQVRVLNESVDDLQTIEGQEWASRASVTDKTHLEIADAHGLMMA
jgi:hypothetical protein